MNISIKKTGKGLNFSCPGWKGFGLGPLLPTVHLDGNYRVPDSSQIKVASHGDKVKAGFSFNRIFNMEFQFELVDKDIIQMRSKAKNLTNKPVVLNRVSLLEVIDIKTGHIAFGRSPSLIKIMEQGNYWGKIRSLDEPVSQESNEQGKATKRVSDLCWVIYDSEEKMALLVGFETSERWLGQIEMLVGANGVIKGWSIGFDGGDLLMKAGEQLGLEEVVFLAGRDPWNLLELYGERVKLRHKVDLPKETPVSWCSWYPYRLGVTEGRILENAKIAAKRLKPLGLSIMEADLGWEKDQLPSTFEENEQFPHGLKWLSQELKKLGFKLGVWKAPYTISEFDPLVKEHPEWLIRDGKGKPAAYWTWFWEPHGKVFILDLTHPGAQKWLEEKIASLGKRGVQYLKVDFIGCARNELAKRRHNQKIVSGGGCEAARIGAEIIRESLQSIQPDALILNCSGPELPGLGMWPLLYTCNDTGNTGYQSWDFHQENYHTVATHLFKNRRWGIIQPSCLCVGLPGTLEEARVRATVAFLAGGQIDISDNLSNLPEDRWQVLEATLPPLGITARPVDLFEPLTSAVSKDAGITTGKQKEATVKQEQRSGSLWHVHLKEDWDEWDLVGIFSLHPPTKDKNGKAERISRFTIPLERLGLNPQDKYWAYEFWSGQFLGAIPGKDKNPHGYVHGGDSQALIASDTPGMLDIAFVGPGVKLICLRKIRLHPWIVGSSFHQSVGAELKDVEWDEKKAELRGELHRPVVQQGFLNIAGVDRKKVIAEVEGKVVPTKVGSMGSLLIPIVTQEGNMYWRVLR